MNDKIRVNLNRLFLLTLIGASFLGASLLVINTINQFSYFISGIIVGGTLIEALNVLYIINNQSTS